MTEHAADDVEGVDDDEVVRRLVARLARPHKSGGHVIERAALLSAGGAFDDAVEWIRAHGGTAEYAVAARGARSGMSSMGGTEAAEKMPLRFVLPAGALESQSSM